MHNILIDEEIYWKQYSRANWLKEEDKNTSSYTIKHHLGRKRTECKGLKIK